MPTQSQVQQTILSAQYKLATYMKSNLALINAGNLPKKICLSEYLNLNILGLTYRANIEDYTSPTAITLYDRLLGLIGIDTTVNTLDPNYQNPTSPIIIPGQSAYGYVTSLNIVFSGQTSITLANWQTVYAPLYGQLPTLEIYTNQGGIDRRDYQTEPTYVYATPGDPTTPLQSITWTYPIATTGYYRITGQIPTTGGNTPIGGTATYFLVYSTNPNISYDGGGNFVYTDTRLIGKSGYYINVPQNNQNLFDGIGIQSNPAQGSFTMLGNPGFVLDPNYPLIVNLN